MKKERREQIFLQSLVYFSNAKTCVEIGVSNGDTSRYFCEALVKTGGKLFGYDIWSTHGQKKQFGEFGSKEGVAALLTASGFKNFSLTKIDTINDKERFSQQLKNDCPAGIDFAFIDGDHSYRGIANDFSVVYPLLNPRGIIAFHDTLRIDGCREFVLDLRNKFYDGTYDIVDFPWGMVEWDCGVTLLVKRSYPVIDLGIEEVCGSPSTPSQIEKKECEWYKKQMETAIESIEKINENVTLTFEWIGRKSGRSKFQ